MTAKEARTPDEQKIIELTSFMLHKHYGENDAEAVIALFDEDLLWLGAGEEEYAVGAQTVASFFRRFVGMIPRCNISGEEYHVLALTPDIYLCSGRAWIATDASTQISLRVHQRITTVFRRAGDTFRCCHIHASNPYADLAGDIGFPVKMALQSYQYLQEQVEAQKKQIAAQTALLERLSFEDSLTGLYNRNKFNAVLDGEFSLQGEGLGVACFDLNGLKEVNDKNGHTAGDLLICSAAAEFRRYFHGKAYRIGGDEFVIIDSTDSEQTFWQTIQALQGAMRAKGVSCSAGVSWRSGAGDLKAQYEEADAKMYENKRQFYSTPENDRRS